ncbi:MAG: hypothetical protein IJO17_00980 [Alistipes sp.]|nr:hypothetical protein [Alistipes sp.]
MKRRARFFGWGNKGRKLSTPTPDDGKLQWADILLFIAATMIICADKFNWIPDFPYKEVVITSIAIVLIIYSIYSNFHNLCPMSRWGRLSWATGMIAITWSLVPLICYATGLSQNWERMWHISAWSAVMWVCFLLCVYNLWRVKRRTRAEIAMIEWRSRNRRKAEL